MWETATDALAMVVLALRADVNLAWPSAEIAVTSPEGAVNVIYRKEIQGSDDPDDLLAQKTEEYRKTFANPFLAASLTSFASLACTVV